MISRQSDEAGVDYQLLEDTLSKVQPPVEVVILSKRIGRNKCQLLMYCFHMLLQIYHICTSKLVILDGYCIVASLCQHKKETKQIQIWHATAAIKKFGWQIIGKPSGVNSQFAQMMEMHKGYDYVLAPSKRTARIYQEAFNVGPETLVLIGLPRLSLLTQSDETDDVLRFFGKQRWDEKPTVLYIPTFREGKQTKTKLLIDSMDFNKFNLWVKLHPNEINAPKDTRVLYPAEHSAEALIKAADIIITDYSSLAIEAAIIGKPLFFFVYDIDEYRVDPGLNMDFENEPISPYVFRSAKKLCESLEEPYDMVALRRFRDRYVEISPEHAVAELTDFLDTLL